MSDLDASLFNCPDCGGVMDISSIPPYTRAKCPHCGVETRVKTRMGRYELTGRLGVGGMSLVFTGKDEDLDRELAVKILNEDYQADPERILQFEREARITASLSHPNIVRVFTVGEDLGRFFIAMELVEGDSLEALIRRSGALGEREVLHMAIEVVEGLRAAAAAGLIHRDIKPGNILIDEKGRARIVDFGLALLSGESEASKEIWATPYYVPPETLEGKEEDFRGDMYALGATLYHALAGRPPCPDDSLSIDKLKQAKLDIEPLGEANPNLNRSTVEVVELAMAHNPEDRFESYDIMLDSLKLAAHSLATGEELPPFQGSRRSERHRAREGERSRRLMLRFAGVAVLLSGLGIWAGAHFLSEDQQAGSEVGPPIQAPRMAPPEEGAVEELGGDIFALYQESRGLIDEGNYTDAAELLMRLTESTEAPLTTVSWAAFEAAACYYQDGKSGEARQAMVELRRRLEQSGEVLDGTASSADAFARMVLQIPPVSPEQLPPNPQGIEKLGYFVAGLKNWEQGQLPSARQLISSFAEIPLTEATEALKVYQDRAQAYLRDADRLEQVRPRVEGQSLDELSQQRRKIDDIYMALETRGRARFQIREWNLALARKQRDLREDQAAMLPEVVDKALDDKAEWEDIGPLVARWDFDGAIEVLQALPAGEADRDEAAQYLLETALNFKYNLMNLLESEKPVLVDGDDQVLGEFIRFSEDRLVVANGNGGEREVSWSDLSVEQLDRLFLARAKAEPSLYERDFRFEQLIVFNFLVGDRERATGAATRLNNEAFKKRWAKAMKFNQLNP